MSGVPYGDFTGMFVLVIFAFAIAVICALGAWLLHDTSPDRRADR